MRLSSKRFSSGCLLLAILLVSFNTSSGAAPETRSEFAKAASQLKQGMSEMQVRSILGPPDKIHAEDFGTTSEFPGVVFIWFYGTTDRNGFPSWGRVYFSQEPFVFGQDSHPEVAVIYGGQGAPPGDWDELELRNLLSIIADLPRLDWRTFDPQPLIVACNALQPLGKSKTIAVIEEYLRVFPDTRIENVERISLLLRVLSEIPARPGFISPPDIGEFAPPPPVDLRQSPRFPIQMVKDIPFLITSGYITGGDPPNLTEELNWFRENGDLRTGLLQPAKVPAASSDWLKQLLGGLPLDDTANKEMQAALKAQWLRLLAHNPQFEIKFPDSSEDGNLDWLKAQKQLKRIAGAGNKFIWDAKKSCYVIEE